MIVLRMAGTLKKVLLVRYNNCGCCLVKTLTETSYCSAVARIWWHLVYGRKPSAYYKLWSMYE